MRKLEASNIHVSELYIGRVVEEKPIFSEHTDIGHILGFDNVHGELLLVVKFSKKKDPCLVHPANVNIWMADL